MMDVAIIIVSWNVRALLADCLRSVYADLEASGLEGQVWVVDNASTDGSIGMVRDAFPQAHLIANHENCGFGAANNQGMVAAAAAQPRYFLLLNPDTIVQPGAIRRMAAFLDAHPKAAMAGARLVYGDGRFQNSAFAFPGLLQLVFELFPMPARLYESRLNGRYSQHRFQPQQPPFPIDHPLGATMMVRASVAVQTGGFDPLFHMYCEEIDWCWRIWKAGWSIYAVPAAEVVHFSGESTGQTPVTSLLNLWQSRARLYYRHHAVWRFVAARWLVRLGMKRWLAQSADPQRAAALRQIIHTWQEIDREK